MFVLPDAAIPAADRLRDALMVLLRAAGHIAKGVRVPTLPRTTAEALFHHLCRLVMHLTRIDNFGVRPARQRAPKPAAQPPKPPQASGPRTPSLRLPTPRGWLLAALPEIAAGVAAELRPLLADPSFAALLAADPSLNRRLGALLRALDLQPPAAAPEPTPASRPSAIPATMPAPPAASLPRPGAAILAPPTPVRNFAPTPA